MKSQSGTPEALAEWEKQRGTYAPRAAIIALRMADLAGYAALVVALWWTGWVVLESPYLAILGVLPMTIIPLFGLRVAFASASGDIFCMAVMAAALAVWTYCHVRGNATAWLPLAIVAALIGLAAAAKLIAILTLVAYWTYLAIYSRGWRRLVNPIAAGAVAFVVFAMLDPIVFIDPLNPFRMCLMMIEWRLGLVAGYVSAHGPMTWTEFLEQALFWWPMTPAIAFVVWRSRSKPWFAPVALWGGALFFGTIMQLAHTRMLSPHYLAPLELGLYFPVALMLIAAAKDARAPQ
jgi:hypothetical protein